MTDLDLTNLDVALSPEGVAARVAAGAAWLDENHPGWVDLINLDRLNLVNACTCVLGQALGDFWTALADDLNDDPDIAAGYGFNGYRNENTPWYISDDQYAVLEVAWADLIRARRTAAL